MGKKNKKWKKNNKNKNKIKNAVYYSDVEVNPTQVNQVAYQVFGSLYYTSDNS